MPLPTLTLLDSFNRVENPLSNGGKWAKPSPAARIGETNETWRATSLFSFGEDSAYWTPAEFTNPAIAANVTHLPSGSERLLQLWACISNPTTAEISGYRVRFIENGEGTKEATVVIEKCVKKIFSTLATITNVAWPLGKIALQVNGGKVIAWHEVGGTWTVIGEAADSTFTKGFVGIGAQGTEGHLQNAEAGETAAAHEHTLTAQQHTTARIGTGQLTLREILALGREPVKIALTPNGRFAYVTEWNAGLIRRFQVVGEGVLAEPVTVARAHVFALCISPSGERLYALTFPNVGKGEVVAYSINAETGNLTVINALAEQGEGMQAIAISPVAPKVFAADYGGESVREYACDETGKIALVRTVAVGEHPKDVCFTPDGNHLLVLGNLHVKVYAVAKEEELTLIEERLVTEGRGVTPSPDGGFVYIFAEHNEKSILQFKIDKSTGKLTPLEPATVACGGRAHFGVISPDGVEMYVTVGEEAAGWINEFAVDPATGKIEGFKPGTVSATEFPFGIAMTLRNVYAVTKNSDQLYRWERNTESRLPHILSVAQNQTPVARRGIARALTATQAQVAVLSVPPKGVDLLPMVV